MKIAMLTSNTALSGKVILRRLVAGGLTPAAVIIERSIPDGINPLAGHYLLIKSKIKKWGWRYVAAKGARLLRGKIFPAGRIDHVTIHALARGYGVPVRVVPDFNSSECRDFLNDLLPDICTVSGTRILKPDIFRIPTRGCINFHTGLLPKYRGSDTIIWSLYHNDPVGVTIHKIAEKLDGGEIILEETIPVSPSDRYRDIYRKACERGAEMMARIVADPEHYLGNARNKYDPSFPVWKKAPRSIVAEVRKARGGRL